MGNETWVKLFHSNLAMVAYRDALDYLSVPALKEFLKKYGIQTSRYRKEVLLRLSRCVFDLNLEFDPDFEETGTRGATNLLEFGFDFDDPFELQFSADLSLIPDFGLCDIFNYLLFHRTDYDKKKLKAFKSCEDYRLFADGHVLELGFNPCGISDYAVCKAEVKPTQKAKTYLGKNTYSLWFVLEKSSGDVKTAYCQCPGGADGACRHVAAALYALDAHEKTSVTDGPCIWKRRPMAYDQPVPVKRMCSQQARYGRDVVIEDDPDSFDPRHPADRADLSHVAEQKFLQCVTKVFPSSAAACLLDQPFTQVEVISKPKGDTIKLSLKSKVRDFLQYSQDTPEEELQTSFMSQLKYSSTEIDLISKETEGQHDSSTWFAMREGVLTASNFQRIHSRVETIINDPTKDPSKAVDTILQEGASSLDVPAIKWGRKKEATARSLYMRIQRKTHFRPKVHVPGLRLFAPLPYLGCSSDGIVTCRCKEGHPTRLIEIKCPYSLRNMSPKEAVKTKGCVCDDGVWTMPQTCQYYAQIQGQLGIYNLQECSLVMYTNLGIHVVPVPFDKDYFKDMTQRLEFFYKYCVLPKLFARI